MAYPSDSQFIPFLLGGSPFGDVPNDESPGSADMVGTLRFPLPFWRMMERIFTFG
ncbi:hypothetical protein [Brevibacillus porteri]|uniref:hypothetical protein n=1 Tax=Brevibacillus porteri TaxID=2126350 RepID=UPI003D1B0F20